MKKLFSLLLALVLVSSNFSVAFARESTSRSAEEIRAEMQKVREELKRETLKNRISTRSTETLSTEEIIERESATLPLKNKLADLDYELAKLEGRIIKWNDLKEYRSSKNLRHVYNYRGYAPKVGDMLVFYIPRKNGFLNYWGQRWDDIIFQESAKQWLHAGIISGWNEFAEAPGHGENSRFIDLDYILNDRKLTEITRIAIVDMGQSSQTNLEIRQYIKDNLLNKPYMPDWKILTTGKWITSSTYCSHLVWKSFKEITNIDIDGDGGTVVYPVDLITNNFGAKNIYYIEK